MVVAVLQDLGKDGRRDVGERNGLTLLVTKVYWVEEKEFVSVKLLTGHVWCENSCRDVMRLANRRSHQAVTIRSVGA